MKSAQLMHVLLLCVVANSRRRNMEAIGFRKEKNALNILFGVIMIFGQSARALCDVVIILI